MDRKYVLVWNRSNLSKFQWGHDFSAMDRSQAGELALRKMRGFNGATTFQPWIHAGSITDLRMAGCVSMGPRLFSHGYSMNVSGALRRIKTFQWGHDFSAMDTAQSIEYLFDPADGFNGATTFQPWILQGCSWFKLLSDSFNGATTFQPWIHRFPRLNGRRRDMFQWGHDFSAMDTVICLAHYNKRRRSFNGATTFQPWIQKGWEHLA